MLRGYWINDFCFTSSSVMKAFWLFLWAELQWLYSFFRKRRLLFRVWARHCTPQHAPHFPTTPPPRTSPPTPLHNHCWEETGSIMIQLHDGTAGFRRHYNNVHFTLSRFINDKFFKESRPYFTRKYTNRILGHFSDNLPSLLRKEKLSKCRTCSNI